VIFFNEVESEHNIPTSHYSTIPIVPARHRSGSGEPVESLKVERAGGSEATKFLHAKSALLLLNNKEKHLKYSVIESTLVFVF